MRGFKDNSNGFVELILTEIEPMDDPVESEDPSRPLLQADGAANGCETMTSKLSNCSLRKSSKDTGEQKSKRNLLAFWIFGLCNNFSYVIMLSAANDILHKEKEKHNATDNNNSTTLSLLTDKLENATYLECNRIGTGAILLADILPSLLIKLSAPLYIQKMSYDFKVAIIILATTISFIMVAVANNIVISIIGVCFASFSSGFGEVTFLSLTSFFHKDVVSTWSSGTGGAGLFGSLSYAGLTSLGLSPRHTILVMLVIPAFFAYSYYSLLSKPPVLQSVGKDISEYMNSMATDPPRLMLSPKQKLKRIRAMMKYMIPLCLVYIAEYFINQTLFELLYYNNFWLTPSAQYRWLQVDYQLGVFMARSSVNLFHIRYIWLTTIIQLGNVALLQTEVLYHYIPSFYYILAIVLFEGVQGGLAYVNTYYRMSNEISPEYLEFSIGVTCAADSLGVALAGLISIPSHNALCGKHIRM